LIITPKFKQSFASQFLSFKKTNYVNATNGNIMGQDSSELV